MHPSMFSVTPVSHCLPLVARVSVLCFILSTIWSACAAADSLASTGSSLAPNTSDLVLSLNWSSIQPVSHRIPGNFFGLSLEWCNPLHLIGPNLTQPHVSFYNVFPYMSTQEGVGPTLRVGGSSSDRSWYNPLGRPQPDWSDFVANITDDTYIALERVSLAFNSSIVAGVSFRLAYNGSIFAPEVAAMTRVVDPEGWGRRWTIEIGNEQELYDACGSHPYEDYRPCGWGWDNFTVEWDWEREAITQLLPYTFDGKMFQGGGFCCPWFQSKMAAWAIARAARLSSLSFHRYIWNGCGDDPTLELFLSDYAGLAGLQTPLVDNVTLQSAIAAVHAAVGEQFPVYLGEGNSVGCEGMAGITDTFAQVVWLVDYAMALASFNVSGFHMYQFPLTHSAHTHSLALSSNGYSQDSFVAVMCLRYVGWTDPTMFHATPFIWPDPARDEVLVQPTLYGMWMFAFATWNGARVIAHQRLQVTDVSNATKAWTLTDNDGNIVVVLVRKDVSVAGVRVSLQLSGVDEGYDANSIVVSAPNVTSKTGLSMAGLTWDGTTNGFPVPTAGASSAGYQSTTVKAQVRKDGRGTSGTAVVTYNVNVNPTSVVTVVIPTSNDQNASWRRRISTILRLKSDARGVAASD